MSNRRATPGFFLVVLLLSLPLFAQPVRDAVTVEIVDVPVFVTQKTEPVRGLTRDDFELYVNGKPQPIEYFDVAGDGGIRPGETPSLRERRLFLLMFDLAFSAPHQLGRAQKAAVELIRSAPATDLFAIATFSSRRGVWFATPFTTDRATLARGVGSLSTSKSGDPLAIVMTEREREALSDRVFTADYADVLSHDRTVNRIAAEALRDIWRARHDRAVQHQMEDFRDLSARLAMLQGQKHVVLLSEGFDASGRSSPNIFAARNASFNVNDSTGFHANAGSFGWNVTTHTAVRDMTRAFQANDVTLHTLDLKGVHSLFHTDALFVLANETGGRFQHNSNDLGKLLVQLSDSVSHSYVLGFRPAGVKKGHNAIEVKVKDLPRGARVRHREGFSGTPRPFDVNEGLYLADVVLNDVPQTGTAATLERAGDELLVKVPLRPLAAQLGGAGKAEVLLYLFGANGVALGYHRATIDVPANAEGEKALKLALPEGTKVAKALLRVDGSLGFMRMDL